MAHDLVLTLADLRAASFPGTELAVLGFPVAHSLSPRMHNAALAHLAEADPRFASWHYSRFEVAPGDLPEALDLLARRGFRGVNLTVPHKVAVVGLVAEIDPQARKAGAVNTLLAGARGWKGFNTDGYGLNSAVAEAFGAGLAGRPIVLLGAGGAARGAAVECLLAGCASLAIGNRTVERRDALLALLHPLAGAAALSSFDPGRANPPVPAGALVVNATSLGLKPTDQAPLALASIPRPKAVFDMIYNPPETALIREAKALGVPASSGLGMLAHQGAKALEIWTGVPAARTVPIMIAALRT
ncbi:MAG: shikimate dehydrogenase family protein [Opitutaceae bacterium]